MIVNSLRLSPYNISFNGNRPTKPEEVPTEFPRQYLTAESREKTVAILGASKDSGELLPYTRQAQDLASELVKRGYNIVTGAGGNGIMGGANKGAHEAEINPENKNHGECLGIITEPAWGDEDYKNCKIIKKSTDDIIRTIDFDKIAKHIVIFPGGATTIAEAAIFIAKAKYGKADKKPDVSFVGPYQELDSQYKVFEEDIKTLGAERQSLYKQYYNINPLIDEKFPPINKFEAKA